MVAPFPPSPPPTNVKRFNQDGTPTQAQVDYDKALGAWVAAFIASVASVGIPFPTATTVGGVKAATAPTHQFQRGIDTGGNPLFAQPAAGDISGLGSLATQSAVAAGSVTGLATVAISGSAADLSGTLSNARLAAGAAVANLGFTPLRPSNNLSEVNAISARANLGIGPIGLLASLPTPTAIILGGAYSSSAALHQFATGLDTTGALTYAQPVVADVTGAAPLASPTFTGTVSLAGNATFTNAGQRIIADLSSATLANRLAFQTSTANQFSAVSVIPNGTSTVGAFAAYSTSDMTNGNVGGLVQSGSETRFTSNAIGSGTLGVMTWLLGGSEKMRLDSGNVGIGLVPTYQLDVANDIRAGGIFRGNGSLLTNLDAGALATGTVGAARLPAFGSGDVSFATAGGVGTIANAAVTYAKIQNVSATGRFIGRKTAGAGPPEELTATDAKAILAIAAGDVSGLAAIATSGSASDLGAGTLPAGRFPALTGDITTVAGALATTLATVNSNTGSFGSSTAIPSFTVNGKGLITAASTNAVVAPAGTLTGATLAAGVTASSLTSVGTLTGGATGAGFTIALGTSTITGTLGETKGGTAQSSWALGDLLYSSAANTLSKLAGNTTSTKKYLSQIGTGTVSAAPAWAQIAAADLSDGNVGTGAIAHAANPSFTGTAVFQTISAATLGVTTATIVTANVTTLTATTGTIGTLTAPNVSGAYARLTNTSNAGQLALSGTGNDEGGYVIGYSTQGLYLVGGGNFDGVHFVAKSTTSQQIGLDGGQLAFYSDSGLTVGANFTPTARFVVSGTGIVTTGSWAGTAIPVANGGTGATTAANARTNLGLGGYATISNGALTNSLAADVTLSNTANYFDGPSVAQGTSGTWLVMGTVTLRDDAAAGQATFGVKLWDGTTVIDSTAVVNSGIGTSFYATASVSGVITSPAGNLRISVRDYSGTVGKIIANATTLGKDSTITAIRIG